MPQLDFSTYPGQLFWLALSFIALYLLMSRLGLPRISGIIAARRQRVTADLEGAGQMKTQAEAVIAAYERALAEARAEAQRTLKETTERLNAQAAERLREIAQKLAGETAAVGNVRAVAVDVARAATAKLTGIAVDAERTAAAVDAALRERV